VLEKFFVSDFLCHFLPFANYLVFSFLLVDLLLFLLLLALEVAGQ
jgi:hypothetical protein